MTARLTPDQDCAIGYRLSWKCTSALLELSRHTISYMRGKGFGASYIRSRTHLCQASNGDLDPQILHGKQIAQMTLVVNASNVGIQGMTSLVYLVKTNVALNDPATRITMTALSPRRSCFGDTNDRVLNGANPSPSRWATFGPDSCCIKSIAHPSVVLWHSPLVRSSVARLRVSSPCLRRSQRIVP